MKNSKTTIYDVAKYLGISTATVNRALNNNTSVSESTRQRVLQAAEKLNYRPSRTASSLKLQPKRISIIIPENNDEFLFDVKRGIEDALTELADYNFSGEILTLDNGYNQKAYIDLMYQCAEKKVDAILLFSPEESSLIKMAMDDIGRQGIRFGVGLAQIESETNVLNLQVNGKMAGAMAAELLANCLPAGSKTAMVTGSFDYSEHFETINGFREGIARSGLVLSGIYEHKDDSAVLEWLAEMIVKKEPDIKGLYIGTAKSSAFLNKIIELGYAGKVKIIASDMYPFLSELMDQGIIFATIFKTPYKAGHLLVTSVFENLVYGKTFEEKHQYLEPRILINSNKASYILPDINAN